MNIERDNKAKGTRYIKLNTSAQNKEDPFKLTKRYKEEVNNAYWTDMTPDSD